MKIAIASGKGGTGKTTIATSLALSLAAVQGRSSIALDPPLFLDCDVEAPNAHLFLQPTFEEHREIGIPIPQVDEDHCTYCGKCAEVCQFNAIAVMGRKTMVFPQLCHGCGSCSLNCPENAITETMDFIGNLERGTTTSGITFARGILNVGEPMAVPIIRQLKKWVKQLPGQTVILDAPPGSSCPVVETMRGADFLLLVTEPTPFGLHDLKLAVGVGRELGIPVGVIVNHDKQDIYRPLEEFCQAMDLPILMRIPFERAIAEGMACGQNLVDIHPEYQELFVELFVQIAIGKAVSASMQKLFDFVIPN
jgi:MinD superfamily P-loop ATPase